MKKLFYLIIICTLLIPYTFGFSQNLEKIKYENFEIETNLPENIWYTESFNECYSKYDHDEKGYPKIIFEGKRVFHPLLTSGIGICSVYEYRKTKDISFLNDAELIFNYLMSGSVDYGDYIVFFYDFNFAMYGDGSKLITAPWASGMAQGVSLRFVIELYEASGNKYYLDIANKIFNSLFLFKGESYLWFSMIDENNYFWIEEYPYFEPSHVFNGFGSIIIGLYHYYRITKNEDAKFLLNCSLKTVKDNIIKYRRINDLNFYGLDGSICDEGYMKTHISLLHYLYLISNDIYFEGVSNVFSNDLAEYEKKKELGSSGCFIGSLF